MTELTLRRKLQKKKKRKERGRCSKCFGHMSRIRYDLSIERRAVIKKCDHCGHVAVLVWTGGGTGRHAPEPA